MRNIDPPNNLGNSLPVFYGYNTQNLTFNNVFYNIYGKKDISAYSFVVLNGVYWYPGPIDYPKTHEVRNMDITIFYSGLKDPSEMYSTFGAL